MTVAPQTDQDIPRVLLVDPEVLRNPFGVYGRAREASPIIRLLAPGMRATWGLTRLADCKTMLADRRFVVTPESEIRPDVPAAAVPYLQAMHVDGPRHRRLRRLVAPVFTSVRVAEYQPRMEAIVADLLDELEAAAAGGVVDLFEHFAAPLPIDVTIDFLGIPEEHRSRWRAHGHAISSGIGDAYERGIDAVIEDTKAAIAYRRAHPGTDPISKLIAARDEDGSRLDDLELEALVWVTVAASSPVRNFVANAVVALLTHPEQLELLRSDYRLMPSAVEELIRWGALNLISNPRHAVEDVAMHGVVVKAGDPIVAVHASANRDPRAYDDPDRLDITRELKPLAHLGFGFGPHICTGNWLARTLTATSIGGLLRRFPDLALAVPPEELRRIPDPGTWRLESAPVRL